MKILLINHYAGSLEMGMEYRPFYMGREWVKQGHEVTNVCASFSHVRKQQPSVIRDFQEEYIEDVRYVYLKTPAYSGNSMGRILSILLFVFKLFRYSTRLAKSYQPDVVIASSTYPLDIYPSRKIAKMCKAKLVFEVHDLWPLSPIELGGYSPKHPFIRIMQSAEDFACKQSDILISLLPNTLPHFLEHGLDEQKWHYIPNGVVPEDWEHSEQVPEHITKLIGKLKSEGRQLVGYTGSIGLANKMDVLVEAAESLKNENLSVLIIGDGPEKTRLEKQKEEKGLDHVYFLGRIPKLSMPAFTSQMDALFIGYQRLALYRFGINPNKLFDYMMAAKPIILGLEAANDMVSDAQCGMTIPPEDPKALAEAIKKLFSLSDAEHQTMGTNGKQYVLKHYIYADLARKMVKIFQE